MRFSFRNALAAMAQTQAGMQQGQIAAETELQRRQLQQQDRVRQQHSTMLQILPMLGKGSQTTLLSGILGEQDNMAAGRPFDYKAPAPVDMSGYQGPFGGGGRQALAPGSAPSAAPMTGDRMMMGESAIPQGPPAPQQAMGPMMSFPLPGLPGVPPEFTPQVPFAIPLGQPQIPARQSAPLEFTEAPQSVTARVTPRPAPAPAAPPGQTIQSRYGPLSLRGVDPGEVTRLQKDFGELQKWFGDQRLPDQAVKDVAALIRDMPDGIETEEQRDQARRVVESLRVAKLGMGKFAQTQGFTEDKEARKNLEEEAGQLAGMNEEQIFQVLPGLYERAQALQKGGRVVAPGKLLAAGKNIEAMQVALAAGDMERAGQLARVTRGQMASPLKPADQTARMNAAIRLLGEMDPKSRMDPETIRGVFRNFGVEHAIEGLGEGSLRFGTQELEERWDRMIRDTPRFAGAPPARQKLFFDEMVGLGRLLGRKVPLSPGDMFKLDEATQARIARDDKRFEWQKQDRTTDLALEKLRLARARIGLQIDQTRLAKAKQGKDKTGFTINQQATALNGIYGKAVSDYGNYLLDNYLTEAAFDPSNPKNPLEQKAAAKWKRMQESKRRYYQFLTKNGMDPSLLEQAGVNAPEPGGKGKAGTGSLLNEMAAPNRPENKAAKKKSYRDMSDDEFLKSRPGF